MDCTNTVLGLGLSPSREHESCRPVAVAARDSSYSSSKLSLTLSLGGETIDHALKRADCNREDNRAASSVSEVSVKRGRWEASRVTDEEEEEDDDDASNSKKKLRLTKAQSALLEESFKHHAALNPKQKQELARELKLRPRQVEVWFQNRRARTKLKQTETHYEFLKKYCATLTEENRWLRKELQEIKALKFPQPLYTAAATLTMCPCCQKIAGGGAPNNSTINAPVSSSITRKRHMHNPLTRPSPPINHVRTGIF